MQSVVSTLLELDEQGVAWMSGTRVKVIEVGLDKLAHGSSPQEMAFQYPPLSLAQSGRVLSMRINLILRTRRGAGRNVRQERRCYAGDRPSRSTDYTLRCPWISR
jgi:hypothetical protein